MRDENYKIEPLKKSVNYDCGSEDIWGILTLDQYSFITIEKKTLSKISQVIFEEKPAYTENNRTLIKTIINTKLANTM